MEKQLKFVLLLPLKEMALRKVAVLLWSGSDVLASISKFQFKYSGIANGCRKEWREALEPKIKDKVSKLGLPESFAKEMIDLVRPICFEIRRWTKFHEERYRYVEIVFGLTKLCWTTVGRIDDRRTAEKLVRCEEISVVQRYEIACDYCLADCIPLLWEELPEEKKVYFFNKKSNLFDLQFHWPHILKGEQSNLDYLLISEDRNLTSFNQWAFEQTAENGYKSATVHFFQKLTHEEREASVMRSAYALLGHDDFLTVDDERTCDALCYLLYLMTAEEERRFIALIPTQVLLIFLHWPLQDLFLENASLIWTFIPPRDYGLLLSRMGQRFRDSELYFPKLFQDFFLQSPLDFKKRFVGQETGLDVSYFTSYSHPFLSIFIEYEDSESVEVVFRNLEMADRVKLVFNPDAFNSFFKGILMGRWPMVEVCLREAALSDADRQRLKGAFTGFLDRTVSGGCVNRKFKRFFEFLDEAEASSDREKKSRKRELENYCSE